MQDCFQMMINYQNNYLSRKKVEEKVWRMPLHKNYDKLINSKNADMQNKIIGEQDLLLRAIFTKIYSNKHHGLFQILEWRFQNMVVH